MLLFALITCTLLALAALLWAGSKSDYLEGKFLDHVFGIAAFSAPATVYVALFTDSNSSAQRDAGTVTEVSTGTWTNYARAAVTNDNTSWSRTGSVVTNLNSVSFGTAATGSNVSCTAAALYDAATGGNLLYWGDLTGSPRIVQNGDPVSFAAGAMTFTED